MALNSSDLFIVERSGTQYRMDAEQLRRFVGSSRIVDDITERDALTDLTVGSEVYVVDASAEDRVAYGGAKYIWDGSGFIKIAEAESIDIRFSILPTLP